MWKKICAAWGGTVGGCWLRAVRSVPVAVFAALGHYEFEDVEGCGVISGCQAFGMELYAPDRAAVNAFESFYDGVGRRPGCDSESGGYVLGGLVVGGVDHVFPGAGYLCQPCAFYRADGVDGPEVGEGLVVVGLRRFLGGDVLVEGTSEGYVDQLLSPADSQYGNTACGSSTDQVQVIAVAQGVDSAEFRMGLFSVDGRIQILASGQDEGVYFVQHGGERSGVLCNRKQERDASGLDDGLAVFAAYSGVVVSHGAGNAYYGVAVCGLFR